MGFVVAAAPAPVLVPLAAREVVDPATPVAVEAREEEVTTDEVPFAGLVDEEAEEVRVVGRTEEEDVGAMVVVFVRAVCRDVSFEEGRVEGRRMETYGGLTHDTSSDSNDKDGGETHVDLFCFVDLI